MNRSQILLVTAAVAATIILFVAGNTVAPEKRQQTPAADSTSATLLDIQAIEKQVISTLTAERQQYLAGLEADVKRGDIKTQETAALKSIARFYHDSVPVPVLHFHYLKSAALLDNTEKSLTFAAHSILAYLPYAESSNEQKWLAESGKKLFDKALIINPANDSSLVGSGGCTMYGASDSSGPMAGIMQVRSVAERDSANMFAQYMLGIGGVISGQIDKAVTRFETVAHTQPDNIEVMFRCAELHERLKQNDQAIKWYRIIRAKVDRPDLQSELDSRIQQLEK